MKFQVRGSQLRRPSVPEPKLEPIAPAITVDSPLQNPQIHRFSSQRRTSLSLPRLVYHCNRFRYQGLNASDRLLSSRAPREINELRFLRLVKLRWVLRSWLWTTHPMTVVVSPLNQKKIQPLPLILVNLGFCFVGELFLQVGFGNEWTLLGIIDFVTFFYWGCWLNQLGFRASVFFPSCSVTIRRQ